MTREHRLAALEQQIPATRNRGDACAHCSAVDSYRQMIDVFEAHQIHFPWCPPEVRATVPDTSGCECRGCLSRILDACEAYDRNRAADAA